MLLHHILKQTVRMCLEFIDNTHIKSSVLVIDPLYIDIEIFRSLIIAHKYDIHRSVSYLGIISVLVKTGPAKRQKRSSPDIWKVFLHIAVMISVNADMNITLWETFKKMMVIKRMVHDNIDTWNIKGIPDITTQLFIIYNFIFSAQAMIIEGNNRRFSPFDKPQKPRCTFCSLSIVKKIRLIAFF